MKNKISSAVFYSKVIHMTRRKLSFYSKISTAWKNKKKSKIMNQLVPSLRLFVFIYAVLIDFVFLTVLAIDQKACDYQLVFVAVLISILTVGIPVVLFILCYLIQLKFAARVDALLSMSWRYVIILFVLLVFVSIILSVLQPNVKCTLYYG